MPEPTGPEPDVTETETSKAAAEPTGASSTAGKRIVVPPKAKSAAKSSGRRRSEGSDRPRRVKAPSTRRWVAPTFITVGLLGVAWLITYYVAGQYIPYMSDLGNWNILIGMGGMAAAFGLATLWK